MKAVCIALLFVALAGPALADPLPKPGDSVACTDPEALWTLVDAEQSHDAASLSRLMASRCRLLARTRYLLIEERGGVAKLRVFAKPGDWSSSWIAYTLDEMLDPDPQLPPEPIKSPTGSSTQEAVAASG